MIRCLMVTTDHQVLVDDSLNRLHAPGIKWYFVDFNQPTEQEKQQLVSAFDFHPLALEDCFQYLQRPKLEYYDGYSFFVLHALDTESLKGKEINLFANENYVVSYHEEPSSEIDVVFMGSCTNSRIEDLRAFASIVKGRKKADGVRVMVVPGSARVRLEAEAEGLDKVFTEFGAEWRFAGCSMCLGMNPDQLAPGERCASTSNRNFEGRQGKGGRTHLVSPLVAAATAVRGTLSSPSDLEA